MIGPVSARHATAKTTGSLEEAATYICREWIDEVYVDCPDSEYAPVNPRLCGFKRVFLPAGAKETVEIQLDPNTLTVVNEEGRRVSGGSHYVFYTGTSQPDARSIRLTGKKPVEICYERK